MSNELDRLRRALAGRYGVDRVLGQGGMGTVYLAHDLKHDRAVAVKVLGAEVAAPVGATRFLRESTLTARLDHPHIVPLLDSGDADGLLYYVTSPLKSTRSPVTSRGSRSATRSASTRASTPMVGRR